MLFDLKGKRRRLVQGTYLTLAVLMGGGLVLFGIGGDVSGGLFDAFRDGGGGGNGNSQIEKRLDKAEDRAQKNPRDAAAFKEIARTSYQLATADADRETGEFGEGGKKDLRKAARAWKRYLALEPKQADPSLAGLMIQAYTALGKAKEAAGAGQIAAEQANTPQAYLQLVQLWTLAGNKRFADLAGKKAVSLAPKDQRSTVKQAVERAKKATTQPTPDQTAEPGGVPAP